VTVGSIPLVLGMDRETDTRACTHTHANTRVKTDLHKNSVVYQERFSEDVRLAWKLEVSCSRLHYEIR